MGFVPRSSVPRGRRIHKFVWVFKEKRDGTAKARLCVQGCTLEEGSEAPRGSSSTQGPAPRRHMLHPRSSAYYRLHGRPCRSRRKRAARRQESTGERTASPIPPDRQRQSGLRAGQPSRRPTASRMATRAIARRLDSADSRLVKECYLTGLSVCDLGLGLVEGME